MVRRQAKAQKNRQAQAKKDPPTRPVSVLGLADQHHQGDRLRIGAVRTQSTEYTSYDVRYRSSSTTRTGDESYTITGVLNVPRGSGPFPAVVLAHGYIDPAVYVRGQGMERERDYLATRGYIALHVDYRNHAGSDDDPLYQVRMRLGYSADVINAVKALRSSPGRPRRRRSSLHVRTVDGWGRRLESARCRAGPRAGGGGLFLGLFDGARQLRPVHPSRSGRLLTARPIVSSLWDAR